VHCVEEQTEQGKILVIKCVICGERLKTRVVDSSKLREIPDDIFVKTATKKYNFDFYNANTKPCKKIGCTGFYHDVAQNKNHLCVACRANQQKWINRSKRNKAFGPSPLIRRPDGMWEDNPEYEKGKRCG